MERGWWLEFLSGFYEQYLVISDFHCVLFHLFRIYYLIYWIVQKIADPQNWNFETGLSKWCSQVCTWGCGYCLFANFKLTSTFSNTNHSIKHDWSSSSFAVFSLEGYFLKIIGFLRTTIWWTHFLISLFFSSHVNFTMIDELIFLIPSHRSPLHLQQHLRSYTQE